MTSASYTLADIQALKAEMDAKKYAPGGVLGPKWSVHVGSHDGFLPVGLISEDAFDTVTADETRRLSTPLKCPHCTRDWHTAPLTQRVAAMVGNHKFDPTYKAAEDSSPVVCVGSETCGPNRPPPELARASGGAVDQFIKLTTQHVFDQLNSLLFQGLEFPKLDWPTLDFKLWTSDWEEIKPEPCPDVPELDIKPELLPIATKQDKWVKLPTRERLRKALAATRDEWREPIPVMVLKATSIAAPKPYQGSKSASHPETPAPPADPTNPAPSNRTRSASTPTGTESA